MDFFKVIFIILRRLKQVRNKRESTAQSLSLGKERKRKMKGDKKERKC